MTTHGSDYKTFEEHSVQSRRLLRQEELIVEVTEAIARALKDAQMTQSQLAERLGKTKGFVSQILGGGRNLTLRTLSDVVDALEAYIRVDISRELEMAKCYLDWPEQEAEEDLDSMGEYANENHEWERAA